MNEKLTTIIDQLKSLTLLEAAELVTEIEKVFGVDTSVAAAPAWIPPSASSVIAEAVEEKTSFDLVLQEVPADKKIAILKVVRSVTGLGLKEAKEIVDTVPKLVKEGISKEESEKIKKEIEEVGGKVTIS
jgi:large subunit ribosomal protein L7/L12